MRAILDHCVSVPVIDVADGTVLLKEGETTDDIFGFLTTEPNAEVGAIHPKAMPVILRTREEIARWLTAPLQEALELQRPLPDKSLIVVARGLKMDAEDQQQMLLTSGKTQSNKSAETGLLL